MAQQISPSPTNDSLTESSGCCGVVASRLLAGVLLIAAIALGITLVSGPPDRWQGIADANMHPLTLITDPRHPQTVYAGTEQGHILISHDAGQNWQEAHTGLPANTPVSALALLPDGTQMLAGTSKGAYLSADGGKTWRSAGPGIPSHTIVDAVAALPDGTLLVGTAGRGVYMLPDGAAAWAPATKGLPPQSDIYAFLPLAQRGHILAALISGGIYTSTDNGMTWVESDRGLSSSTGVNVFSFLAIPDAHGKDVTILAGTSRGVFSSRDQGTTWAPSSTGIGTTRVISLTRDPIAPGVVFAGTDTGVFQSQDDGVAWRMLGFGLPAKQHVGAVGAVHLADGERVILASVDQLYRYPGQWLLASEPWRALGIGILIVLALALVAFAIWWTMFISWPGGSPCEPSRSPSRG
ncbi:MAG: WD40/YVTN/BNR-like repeat-containing protein [Nitrososphaerota archaeon]